MTSAPLDSQPYTLIYLYNRGPEDRSGPTKTTMLFIQWVRLFPTKQECVAQSTLETPPQETLCKTRLDFVFYTWNEGRRIRRNSLNHLLGFPPLVQQKKKFHRTQPSTAIILSSSKGWLIPPPPPVRYDKTWYFEAARTFVWQGIGRSILDLLSTRCGGSMVLLSLTRFAPLKCQCPRYSFGNSVPMYLWHKTKCQCIFGTRPGADVSLAQDQVPMYLWHKTNSFY